MTGKKRAGFGLATFVVDPPTMLLAGVVFVGVTVRWIMPRIGRQAGRKVLFGLCAAWQLAFWVLGAMMYFDVPYFAERGLGNDFMWNGYLFGLQVVDTTVPTYKSMGWNALAFLGWAVQPVFLWLGVQLGYILFGRNEAQTGAVGLWKEL
jgi:hypothetical protein